MESLLLTSDSESTMKLLMELAKKLGVTSIPLTKEDQEDITMGVLMNILKSDELVDESEILKALNKK